MRLLRFGLGLLILFGAQGYAQQNDPSAVPPPADPSISTEEQRRILQERLKKFREGRNLDENKKNTRMSEVLETHEGRLGELDHANDVPAASELEKVLDKYSKKETVIQDTTGSSVRIQYDANKEKETESFYNYVKPHDGLDPNLKTKVDSVGIAPVVEDEHGYRRVLKDGALEDIKKVGDAYSDRVFREAGECDYNLNARGCAEGILRLPNRDFLYEEANWLKTMVQLRSEDSYRDLMSKRLNEGVDPLLERRTAGSTAIGDLSANKSNATGPKVLVANSRRILNPDFTVTERSGSMRASDLLTQFDLERPSPLVRQLLTTAIQNWRAANPTRPEATRPYPPSVATMLSDPVLKSGLEAELQKILDDPREFEVKKLSDLLNANQVCKDPRNVCVYDPEKQKVVPFEQYYKTNDYGALVTNLEELVQREHFLAMTNPLALHGSPLGVGNIDRLSGRHTETGESEEQIRSKIIAEVLGQQQQVKRILQWQYNDQVRVNEALAGGDASQVAPVPTDREILLSVMMGRQLPNWGGGEKAQRVLDFNDPDQLTNWQAEKNESDVFFNIDENGNKKDERLSDTFSGTEVGGNISTVPPPAAPGNPTSQPVRRPVSSQPSINQVP